ncbi:hypothetical protein FQZ97_929790 [compost metagenome]
MHRVGDRAQVVVGQHHAGGGFHVRREHQRRFFCRDGGFHVFNRRRRPGGLRALGGAARLHHGVAGGDRAHVEDLRPAVAEPAVADHHHVLAVRELARHGFHAEGAAARHQHGGVRAVDALEHGRDVGHHALEAFGHVVERAVGVDDRKLEQTIGVDVGQQSGHVCLLAARRWAGRPD